MREGSAPNFCPPTEEGITLVFEDESGDRTELEFLGLILHNDRSYGFFFPGTQGEPDQPQRTSPWARPEKWCCLK